MSEPTTDTSTTTDSSAGDDGLFGSPGAGIDMGDSLIDGSAIDNIEASDSELQGFDITEEVSNGLRQEEETQTKEVVSEVAEEPEVDARPPRMIALGDNQFEADTEVVVNGQRVPLGSLVDDYIGQKEINRRFTEFDKQKKSWENDVVGRFNKNEQLVLNEIKKLQEAADSGEYSSAIASLAKMAGANPVEFERKIIQHVMESAEGINQMSEAEEKAYWAQKEAEHAKSQLQERETAEKTQQERAALKQNLVDIIHTSGLSERQFEEAYRVIRENPKAMETLRSLKPQEATQAVCTFYLDSAKEDRVIQAVEALAPDYKNKDYLISSIFSVADYDYSVEDMKEVLSEYLGLNTKTQSRETPSKEPAANGKPERAASAISNLSNLEAEDAIGWDFA
jgi:hypothetical protein